MLDGTCSPDLCPSLLIEQTTNSITFCVSPCTEEEEYLYEQDGECRATCEQPFTATEETFKLCSHPCEDNLMYYLNDTQQCESSCEEPNVVEETDIIKYCKVTADVPTLSDEEIESLDSLIRAN